MEAYVFPVLCIVMGLFFLVRNIAMLRNEDKMRNYLETSPKATLWVNKFGLEKTMSLSKSIFLPLGCAVSLSLIGFGSWSIYSIAHGTNQLGRHVYQTNQ
jgi:hypothetical protein